MLLLSLLPFTLQGPALRFGKPPPQQVPLDSAADAPLLLSGMPAAEARAAAAVSLPGWGAAGYSGFFTTNEEKSNHMFFWYFPKKDAPLLIWLQGGPGGSSMFGLFAEMGPFNSDATLKLVKREASWTSKYAMLFIDNPVGAGFSFTTSESGYCNDTKVCVASNLFSLLQQFYGVFPEMLQQELYITGESYGGHYVPGFAAYIHEHNARIRREGRRGGRADAVHIPLAGMAIGDGWIDPVNMLPAYPDMIYNFGLCDENEKAKIQDYCDRTVAFIQQGKMLEAFDVWDQFLNGDVWPYGNYFHNISGLNDYDNYMNTNAPASFDYYAPYLNQPAVRAALHVGNVTFPNAPSTCEKHLLADFMVSFVDELVTLLDSTEPHYKVLVYSGQLDVIIGAALTERFLPSVPWGGQAAYRAAPKAVWRVNPSDKEVAGYARVVGNFSQVVVRAAGHIVPGDQPERALDMITRFVEGRAYENLPNPQ